MSTDSIVKYGAGAAIMASVFALVILGKVDASLYVALATSALAGLGVHAAGSAASSKTDSLPPSQPQEKP